MRLYRYNVTGRDCYGTMYAVRVNAYNAADAVGEASRVRGLVAVETCERIGA